MRAFALATVAVMTVAMPVAHAQSKGKSANTVVFGEEVIAGRAQAPQVSFIVPRSSKINLDVDIRRFKPQFSLKNQELMEKYPDLFEMK